MSARTKRRRLSRRRFAFEQLESRQLLAAINFTNPAGGLWNTPSNWDLGRIPLPDDTVVIDIPGEQTVTVGSGNFTALSINSAEKLVLTGNLNVPTITGSGKVELRGGGLINATLAPETTLVGTGLGGTVTSVTVNGNFDLSGEANSNARILGGFVLNGNATLGNTAGTTYGIMYFGDFTVPTGSFTGAANVIFGGNSNNLIQNGSNLTGSASTLTIGPDVTVSGKTGVIYNLYDNGSIVSQATVNVGVTGGSIRLGGNGSSRFTNAGTVNVSNGTLNWYGSSTLVGLGTINRTGGTINLGGTLDLQGAAWNLNASTGSWNLFGGTVKNGTINETDGSLLVPTNTGGTLEGITVNGDLDLSRQVDTWVRVLGGLVLNGTALLGNTSGTTYGIMYFGNFTAPTGSFTGAANVIFGGSSNNLIQNGSNLTGSASTLTIGPDVTVSGKTGVIYNLYDNGSIVSQATVNVGVTGGSIRLGGNGSSRFTNAGTVNVSNGTLNWYGSSTLVGLGTINRTGGTINLGGTLDLQGAAWNLNASTGSWNLFGGTVKNGTINETDGSLLVPTNTGGTLEGITVNGDLDLSRQVDTWVRVLGGLVLNGTALLGNTSGTTYGIMYFGNFTAPTGSFTGAANVIFGGSSNNLIQNGSNLTGSASTLTIGPDVTVSGKTGVIYNLYDNGSIVSQATVNVGVTGGSIRLGGNGSSRFTNAGTVNVSNGTLNWYGSSTLVGLGTINRTGGTINLGGTLDLQGAAWNLNASTGSWNLFGGTVKNGTINETDGSLLVPTNTGGTLEGITVNGDLDLSRQVDTWVRVLGGLVLNGTALLGNTSGTTYGIMYFGNFTAPTGSITGAANVIFGGSSNNLIQNGSNLTGSASTLTIGPDVTVSGKTGVIYNLYDNGSIVSQATVNVGVTGGSIRLGGNGSSRFTNAGTVNVSNGTLNWYGSSTLVGLGTINRTGGTINLGGTLDLQGAAWNLNASTGSWNLFGGTVKNGTINETDGSLLVPTNTGGTLEGITVNGDLDLSRQVDTWVRVLGGLVLNGTALLGNTSGTTYGIMYFGNFTAPTGSFTGAANVIFGGSSNNLIQNGSNLTGSASTLTIGPDVTVSGKTGVIYNLYDNGSIVSQATVNVGVTGGSIRLGGNGSSRFANAGTVNVSNGTLNWYGSSTLVGLGTINRTGGTINLGGTLDLQGAAWNLNASTGSWNLFGGTVKNGTINASDGARLVMTDSGGALSSINFNGTLDLSQQVNANVSILGGLVHDGTMLLGNTQGTTYGRVYFQDNGTLGNSLTGESAVVFGGNVNNFLQNNINRSGAAGTLTLGPDVTVRGSSGYIYNAHAAGSILNQGTINNDVGGGGFILGNATVGSFASSGAINVLNGATLNVPSGLSQSSTSVFSLASGSSLLLNGNLSSAATSSVYFRPAGAINIAGGTAGTPRLIEAMSQNVGAAISGFTSANFVTGALTLAASSYIRLVDQIDNSPQNSAESLYVNSVVIPVGSTLDLNGLQLYTRALQQGGSVLNGTITVIPDSGALTLGTPTPGALSEAGQLDEWTFFSFAGRQVTVVVNPGAGGTSAPIAPQVNWVRVEVLDSANNVLASATNSTQGGIVTINNVALTANGVYRVRINAPAGHLASTGNYIITAWNSTPNVRDMELNRTVSGAVNTPYGQDQWNFSAASGAQVQFDLINTSTSGLSFTLNGPNGYAGFTDITGDSSLVTLPFDGAYSLIARGLSGAQGSYAFVVKQTAVTDVALGGTYSGRLVGTNDARIFRVNVPVNQVLTLNANDATATDRIEMYARFGAPPTREVFEYRYGTVGNSQQILIPGATAGDWYILIFAANVPTASSFTFSSQGANAKITSVLPERAGNALPVHMTIQGAGFANGTTVELIAPSGTTTFAPTSFTIDSYTQITANFQTGLPVGSYSVRVTRSGNVDTLSGALEITAAGQSQLQTQLIMPPVLGRRTPATLYIEYANTGDLAMPAPLIILQSTDADDSDKPILSLDENRRTQDFWTSVGAVLPPGTSHSILLLASGKQPGILNPGERIRIPVYYMGLLFPWANDQLIEMELRYWTQDDTSAIDWPSRQESLRPPTLGAEQWSAVFGNLIADIPTTGDYVRMLNENAEYLGRLGQNVVSVDDLWNFEVQQAYGVSVVSTLDSATDAAMPTPGMSLDFSRSFANSIQSRYATGPLGQGWYTPWQTRLFTESAGKIVRVVSVGGSAQTFGQDSRNRSYFSGTGDSSTLVTVVDGYELRATNGSVTKFRADGRIEFVRDTNNNRVTSAYHADGRLLTLTHSSGASLTIGYNAAGRVTSVTDSAGRITAYGYDATNTYLTSVTTADGKVTNYAYQTTGSPQVKHSLLSIERGGTTQFFTYDSRGRLDTSFLTGNAQLVDYIYSNTGLVSVADSVGSTSLYFDHNGLLSKVTDPLGFITTNQYDTNFRLSKTVSPTGESQSFTWCACGSMTSVTNEQGFTTQFAYDNPFKRMTSFTDARGQKTSYTYDANGNLLTTVYPNGSVERLSNYAANGLAQTSTNRRGQVMSYTYNSAGQVTRQTFADSTFITYAYDTRGNLTTVTDGAEVTNYTYNFATDGDRLKRITYPNGRYLDYTYDSFGRRIRMTDQDNFQTRYEYDAAGRLYRLRDAADTLLVTYLYDASGRLSRIDKGNGTFTTYTYDVAGQLLSLKNWRNATELNSKFDYTYDSRGRRISMVTLDGTWTYGYDGTGQLIRAVFASLNTSVIPDQDLTYMYDPAGNRIRTIENGVTTEYVTNGLNQYTSVRGVAQTYDADGNLTFDGINTYVYDQQSRLVRVTGTQGVAEYEYDAFGNRTAKIDNGTRTEYLNDPSDLEVAVAAFSFSGHRIATYSHGLGLVGVLSSATWNFFDFDAIGSTIGVVSANGSYVNRYSYEPFGKELHNTSTVPMPFRFGGQFGAASELNNLKSMGMRSYDAETGRFTGIDPLRIAGGESNFYRYASNNVSSVVDPSGLVGFTPQDLLDIYFELFLANEDPTELDFATVGTGVGVVFAHFKYGFGAFAFDVEVLANSSLLYGYRFGMAGMIVGTAVESYQFGQWLGTNYPDQISELVLYFRDGVRATFQFIPELGRFLTRFFANAVGGTDPNEKQAAVGYGPEAFVASNTAIPYRIDFENYKEATAPAQVVTITDSLSSNFDWSSFRLTEAGFGDMVITIPANTQYYQTTRSMTYNGKTFEVLIELGLKAASGEVFALFQSLDPNSQLPPDVLTGFLPPEDGSGRGKGYISYTIRPKANLVTGTEIRNVALISFDGQQTIGTDQVDPLDPTKGIDTNKQARITIDAGLPTSSMAALPPIVTTSAFTLNWAGADDVGGSGIAGYDLFVSTNGGPFVRTLSNIPDTSTVFQGAFDNTYRFYTIAIDNTGQRQPTPTSGFVVTQAIDPRGTSVVITSSKPIGAVYGESIDYSVAVAALLPTGAVPVGTIQWQVDGTNVGSPVTMINGIATLSVPRLTAGQHLIKALYDNTDGTYDDKNSENLAQFIAKANLTVTAQNASKIVTDSMPTFNASITGFLPGDDALSSLTGSPQLAVTNQANYIAGVYPIIGSQGSLASANYAFQFVSGQLTVYSLVSNKQVYHRGSSFSQGGANINAALDSGKVIAQSGLAAQTLGYLNLINTTRGINGIVLDVAGLSGQALTADDFVFRMSPTGLFNEAANPPSSWTTASTPTAIVPTASTPSTVGRIRLEWNDNAIANRWLQIQVLPSTRTGLLRTQVFYVGHLQGEVNGAVTGGAFFVTTQDQSAVLPLGVANIASARDLDKNSFVTTQDLTAVRNSINAGRALRVITIPAAGSLNEGAVSGGQNLVAGYSNNRGGSSDSIAEGEASMAFPINVKAGSGIIYRGNNRVEVESHQLDSLLDDKQGTLTSSSFSSTTKSVSNSCPAIDSTAIASSNLSVQATKQRKADRMQLVDAIMADYLLGDELT